MAAGLAKNSLFVKNLSPQVTDAVLREVFEPLDAIEKITFRAYPSSNNQFFAQIDFRTSVGVAEGSKLSGTSILGVQCTCGVVDPITTDKQLQIAAAQQTELPESLVQGSEDAQLEIFRKQLREEAEDQRLRTVHIAGFAGPVEMEAVRRLCTNFGEVDRVRVEQDVQGTTFALVEFRDRGSAHVCKMQRTFKVDGRSLVFTEAKAMVDDKDIIERGVQFQAPIFDAINMGTVLRMQGLLSDKLERVKSAAQELEVGSAAEDAGVARRRSMWDKKDAPSAPAAGDVQESAASQAAPEAAQAEPEEGKKRKGKEKKKAKEKKAKGDADPEAPEKRRKKEKKDKEKKKKKKKKEKDKAKKKAAKRAAVKERRKQVAAAAAGLRSDDVQARFDACVTLRTAGALAGRHAAALEKCIEDEDVDVREAAQETFRILGEAGFLQQANKRQRGRRRKKGGDSGSEKSSAGEEEEDEEDEEESAVADVESSGSGPVDLVDEVEVVENTELLVLADGSASSISLSSDSSSDSSVELPQTTRPRASPPGGGGVRCVAKGGVARAVGAARIPKGSIDLDGVGVVAAMDSDEDSVL